MKHKKFKKSTKIISVILSLLLIIGTIVAVAVFNTASAETFTDDNGISWTVTESYPGWAISPTDKNQIIGTIEIPATYNGKVINSIDDNAFSNCNDLEEIIIPKSVMSIGRYAFNNCSNLSSVDIPDSVSSVGESAFSNCSSLNTITIPNSVTYVGSAAFDSCSRLSSISLPNSIKKIEGSLFSNCTSLSTVSLPDSITKIYGHAFRHCSGLNTITIPNSVTYIDEYAFSYCSNISSITVPDSVTYIGEGAFSNCSSLESIDLPDNITSIEPYTFHECSSLAAISMPNSVTHIGEDAFYQCSELSTVNLSSSVSYIGNRAFNSCHKMTSISIPDSVTYIGEESFAYTKLHGITIPSNISYIGRYAFYNSFADIIQNTYTIDEWNVCQTTNSEESFNIISIFPNPASEMAGDITVPDNFNGKPVTVIEGFGQYNKMANVTSINLPNTIKIIADESFKECSEITTINIPDSVTYIGEGAFSGCNSLSQVNIPSKVKYIGKQAFQKTAITTAIIPNTVKSVNAYTFHGCSSLAAISMPNSVTYIGEYAFSGCTNISSIAIPDSVTYIGEGAFSGDNLTSITVPNSVTKIDIGVFAGCHNLQSIDLPDNITSIEANTFSYCWNLQSISIPDSVTYIGEGAFNHCEIMTPFNLSNSITYIGNNAFDSCWGYNHADISIPSSVEYVGQKAFANIGELNSIVFKNSKLSQIDSLAFYNDFINDYVIDENVKKIDTPLLSGNTELTSVTLSPDVEITNPYAFYGDENLTVRTYKRARSVREYTAANAIPTILLDSIESKKVNFELTCDKQGYEFEVFKVADIQDNSDWYEIRYNSLIPSITDEIFDGNSAEMLKELDKVAYNNLGTPVGSYKTNDDGASKEFNNLDPGIYYVRATNFPANVKWVQNSVFALPYYDKTNGWVYEIDPIPLATKTDESEPEIKKTISNSTRDEDKGRFTDVSLGDTVNFTIKSSTVGSVNTVDSLDFKLKKYEIKDTMSEGLTLNSDSFVVTIEDINGDTTGTLTRDRDYTVNIKTVGTDTVITISLAANYLNNSTDFYSAYNVVTTYTADLNEKAVRGVVGNPNEATSLTWQNKNEVESTVDGNEVYAYTFGIEVNKYNDAGTPLAGSTFALYRTEDDAENQRNAIATGTSTSTGKVEFKTNNNVIRLESGTYYIVETESTQDYNRYTDVITAPLRVEYTDVKTNGTYVLSAPENGILQIDVKNSKVIIPNTGGDGAMYRYIIGGIFLLLAAAFIIMKVKSNKKAKAASK